MTKLPGKIAIVTGSGRGIGRSVALKLASEGASVVVNDLDAEPGDAVVAEIIAAGGTAVACNGTVNDVDFGDHVIEAAIDNFGVPDILVNNAGYTWDNVIHKMSDQQFDALIDVHLKAPFRILRAVQPHWKAAFMSEAEEGSCVSRKVVNITSVVGLGGNAGQVNYSAAKAGVVGLTKSLAKEWGRMNVNVNCVAFGYIETRMTEAVDEKKIIMVEGNAVPMGIPKEGVAAYRAMIPLKRAGTPDDAAGAVFLLTIPESDYITGQTIICGGGLVI